jgi:hypothetical protein
MKRMIDVVDLRTGEICSRPSHARTLDIPSDFDPDAGTATLDFRSRAHYLSVHRKEVVREAMARPLSWRVRGERCLVEDDDRVPTIDEPSRFSMRAIDPADE